MFEDNLIFFLNKFVYFTAQTYNASLLYCTYHLKNEARNLFPKKLIKKVVVCLIYKA